MRRIAEAKTKPIQSVWSGLGRQSKTDSVGFAAPLILHLPNSLKIYRHSELDDDQNEQQTRRGEVGKLKDFIAHDGQFCSPAKVKTDSIGFKIGAYRFASSS